MMLLRAKGLPDNGSLLSFIHNFVTIIKFIARTQNQLCEDNMYTLINMDEQHIQIAPVDVKASLPSSKNDAILSLLL